MKYTLKVFSYCLLALLATLLTTAALLPYMLPTLVERYSADVLPSGRATLKSANIDYFSGDIQLFGLDIFDGDEHPLQLAQLDLRIISRALLSKQVDVQYIKIGDGHLNIEQDSEAAPLWRVAGQTVGPTQASAQEQEQQNKEQDQAPTWSLKLGKLQVNELAIHIDAQKIKSQVLIGKFETGQFDSRQKNLKQELHGEIQLSNTHLLLSKGDGAEQWLNTEAPLSFSSNIKISGAIESPRISGNAQVQNLVLSLLSGNHTNAVTTDSARLTIGSLQTLKLGDFSYKGAELALGGIELDTLQLLPSQPNEQKESLTAHSSEQISLDNMTIAGIGKDKPTITVGNIHINNSQTHIKLTPEYQWQQLAPLQLFFGPGKPAKESEKAQLKAADNPVLSLSKLLISNAHIGFIDPNTDQGVRLDSTIQSLEIGPYSNDKAEHSTPILLNAKLQETGLLKLDAKVQAGQHPIAATGSLELQHFNLVDLSSYFEQQSGYFIHTGQLNINSQGSLKQNQLKLDNQIRVRSIELERVDDERAQTIDQQVSMPLDSALGLLRDSKGDVKLSLPISGDVTAPDFGTGDVIKQLSTKAIKSASISYLKYAFQPYGSLITVGSWLNEQAQKIRLDPIRFAHGQSQMSAEQTDYLTKLATLMQKKEGLRIKACPVGSREELQWLAQQAQTLALTQKQEQEQEQASEHPVNTDWQKQAQAQQKDLNQLRLQQLRQHLETQYKISPERLISCKTQTGNEEALSFLHLQI